MSFDLCRYDARLEQATKAGIRRGLMTAIGGSTFYFMIYASYAIAFWYGVKLIIEERGLPDPEYDPSTMIIVSSLCNISRTQEAIRIRSNIYVT